MSKTINIHGIKVNIEKDNDGKHKYIAKFSENNHKKTLHFGAKGYEEFHDKIGYYSKFNHEDNTRRKQYKQRHTKDRIWHGHITRGYLSDKLLW